MDQRRILQSVVNGGDRGQRFVIHLDKVNSVLRYVPAIGHHHGHGLPRVAHGVAGERPLQVVLQPRQGKDAHGDGLEQFRHVRVGEHGHDVLESQRGRCLYAAYVGMGVRAAQNRRVQHSGQADVIQVLPGSGDETNVLAASNRLPDV